MSLGPTNREEVKLSRFNQLRYETKKVVAGYFQNPVFYLFYGFAPLTCLGLFFGMSFSWQFYVILVGLGWVNFYNSLDKPKPKK